MSDICTVDFDFQGYKMHASGPREWVDGLIRAYADMVGVAEPKTSLAQFVQRLHQPVEPELPLNPSPPAEPASKMLDQKAAALLLKISPQTLTNWRHKKVELSYVFEGRRAYYREADILAFMNSHHRTESGWRTGAWDGHLIPEQVKTGKLPEYMDHKQMQKRGLCNSYTGTMGRCRRGEFPQPIRVGRKVKWKTEEVIAWEQQALASRMQPLG